MLCWEKKAEEVEVRSSCTRRAREMGVGLRKRPGV